MPQPAGTPGRRADYRTVENCTLHRGQTPVAAHTAIGADLAPYPAERRRLVLAHAAAAYVGGTYPYEVACVGLLADCGADLDLAVRIALHRTTLPGSTISAERRRRLLSFPPDTEGGSGQVDRGRGRRVGGGRAYRPAARLCRGCCRFVELAMVQQGRVRAVTAGHGVILVRPPVEPMRAVAVRELPAGLVYAPKWDGFRALAWVLEGRVLVQSRQLRDLTGYFPEIRRLLRGLPVGTVLDGELVIWAADRGRTSFTALQGRVTAGRRLAREVRDRPAHNVVFDLLQDDRGELTALPLRQRRARLEALLAAAPPHLQLCPQTTSLAEAQTCSHAGSVTRRRSGRGWPRGNGSRPPTSLAPQVPSESGRPGHAYSACTPPIQIPDASGELPPYVPRDLDANLRAALTAAAARGGFVLLMGGSLVGKTRALYEAVRADFPDAGFTQVLAAGSALIQGWEQAYDCYGKAVITAALDARGPAAGSLVPGGDTSGAFGEDAGAVTERAWGERVARFRGPGSQSLALFVDVPVGVCEVQAGRSALGLVGSVVGW